MNDQHPDEAIELYALGALDGDEVRAVEEHAATCAACSRRLGEAERTVASLDALTVPMFEVPAALGARISRAARTVVVMPRERKAPNLARWGALAACLAAFGLGIGGVRDISNQRATIAADDRAFAAISVSHFAHTTLTKVVPDAPTAKVLWGKNPHWLYVIVDSPACGCDVIARTATGERDLGAPQARGATATLFVDDAPDAIGVELRAGDRILATAKHP
jgi:Putative zinc-finger